VKEISFVKYSGTGNDFILIDLSKNNFDKLSVDEISKLCARHTGIGADGILLFDKSKNNDFDVRYFNADGSTGSICGNGARCAIHYAKEMNIVKNKSVRFSSNEKLFTGELLENNIIKFNLEPPGKIILNKNLRMGKFAFSFSFADTGSPHIVIDITELINIETGLCVSDKLHELSVNKLGSEIRNNAAFALEGVNVNFIQYDENGLSMRTFERGVEAETLACGTGAAAVAIIEAAKGLVDSPVSINTWGGDELLIEFEINNNIVNKLSLTGNAKQIYSGTVNTN